MLNTLLPILYPFIRFTFTTISSIIKSNSMGLGSSSSRILLIQIFYWIILHWLSPSFRWLCRFLLLVLWCQLGLPIIWKSVKQLILWLYWMLLLDRVKMFDLFWFQVTTVLCPPRYPLPNCFPWFLSTPSFQLLLCLPLLLYNLCRYTAFVHYLYMLVPS